VLSVQKECYNKLTKAPLPDFIASSKGLLQEKSDLPRVCTSDGFDPNVYQLIEKFNYDFSKPPSLGHVIEANSYALNDMQK